MTRLEALREAEQIVGRRVQEWPKYESVEFTVMDRRTPPAQALVALRRIGGTTTQFNLLHELDEMYWAERRVN